MKETLGWFSKKVLFPLLPFAIAALIRYLNSSQFSWQIFDGGELSFSMAISSILIMSSASRLPDKALRDSLTTIYIFILVFFLVMFACSSLLKVQTESDMSTQINQLKNLLQPGSNVPPSALLIVDNMHANGSLKVFDTIRKCAFFFSLITVPGAIIIKSRYPLED